MEKNQEFRIISKNCTGVFSCFSSGFYGCLFNNDC